MRRDVVQEGARVAIIGSVFLAGWVVGGPVGAAALGGLAASIGTELAGEASGRAASRMLRKFFDDGTDYGLAKTYRTAFKQAVDDMQKEWAERNQTNPNRRAQGESLFKQIKEDGESLFAEVRANQTILEFENAFGHGFNQSTVQRALREYLRGNFSTFDEPLRDFVTSKLQKAIERNFMDLLLSNDSVAWREAQLQILGGVQEELRTISEVLATEESRRDSDLDSIELAIRKLDQALAEDEDELMKWLQAESQSLLLELKDHVTTESNSNREQLANAERNIIEEIQEVGESIGSARQQVGGGRYVPGARELVVGPIKALHLDRKLDRADADSDRVAASKQYGEIAAELALKDYTFQARLIRERRAQALQDGGLVEEAIEVWLELAREELEGGSRWLNSASERALKALPPESHPHLIARWGALQSYESWYENADSAYRNLKHFATKLLELDDEWAYIAYAWLGEMLAVDSKLGDETLMDIRSTLTSLIEMADETARTRLRLLVAELDGSWMTIIQEAQTGALARADCGLVHCRYGRWLALNGKPQEAILQYSTAISALEQAKFLGDAAAAIRSKLKVESVYIDLPERFLEEANLSDMIASQPGRFRRQYSARTSGLESFLEALTGKSKTLAEALRGFRRFGLESRISGNLAGEIESNEMMGDVFLKVSSFDDAVKCFVHAGASKLAANAAKAHVYYNYQLDLTTSWPPQLAATLSVIGVVADGISDEDARSLFPRLLELTNGVPQSRAGEQVDHLSWEAISRLFPQLSEEEIEISVDRIVDRIRNGREIHGVFDRPILSILAKTCLVESDQKTRAFEVIAQLLGNDSVIAELATFLEEQLRLGNIPIRNSIEQLAREGNDGAVNLLAVSGIADESVLLEVESRVSAALAYEVGAEHLSVSLGLTFDLAAAYSRFADDELREKLALHLGRIATDSMSPALKRMEAMGALHDMSELLDPATKTQLFEIVLPLVTEPPSIHPMDQFLGGIQHGLSRIHIDMGLSQFHNLAAITSATLACSQEEVELLFKRTYQSFDARLESTAELYARLIFELAEELKPNFPLEPLLVSPVVTVRKLGANTWLNQEPIITEYATGLSEDPDASIRSLVAQSLPRLRSQDEALAQRVERLLLNDRSARVRSAARQFAA